MDKVREVINRAERGDFTKSDVVLLSEATRKALKYMLSKGIPITPRNFEIWFLVFMELLVNKASDDEEHVEEFYEKVLSIVAERDRKAKEIDEVKKRTEEVLEFSSRQIGDVIEKIEESNRFMDVQINALRSVEHGSYGIIIGTLLEEIEKLKEANNRLKKELESARGTLKRLKIKLREKTKEAITDPLTGLYNRGYLEEELKRRIRDFDTKGESFAVFMADLDDFKRVNDVYGHLAGDHVLITFASILKNDLRIDDMAARYGGEEFVAVLARLDLSGATAVANRIRERLEHTPIVWGENVIRVTASFGVAQVRRGDTPDSLIYRADKALYLAKSDGKNCVRSERDVYARMNTH